MTDRSLVQEKILPGQLLLQTEGVCNFDAEHLLEVWGAQRQRFAERGLEWRLGAAEAGHSPR